MDDPKDWQSAAQIIVDELVVLLADKQHDYGHGNITAFGELGVLVRASDKMERLKNLHAKTRLEPRTETIVDSWIDLAGYSIIALMLRRDWFNLPLREDK